jgi:hypothetical protein
MDDHTAIRCASSESPKQGRLSSGKKGKEKIFFRPSHRNALMSLESVPEMEGKGRKWKGVSGLRCTRLKFDCARLGADGASWKDDDFDFPKVRAAL